MKIPMSLKNRTRKDPTSVQYIEQITNWVNSERPIDAISPEDLVQVLGGSLESAEVALHRYRKEESLKRRVTPESVDTPFVRSDAIAEVMHSTLGTINQIFDQEVAKHVAKQEEEFVRVRSELEGVIKTHLADISLLKQNAEKIENQRIALSRRTEQLNAQWVEEKDKVSEMEARCATLSVCLSEHQERAQSLEAKLQEQKETQGQQFKFLSEQHQKQITALQLEYQKLKKIQIQTQASKISAKQTEVDGLVAKLSALEATVSASNQALSRANARAEDAERELEVIQLKVIADSENKYTQTDFS